MMAGLIRMGWEVPLKHLAAHHGALMVGGFLGTLLLLEKVIPLKRKFLLILPLLNAFGIFIVIPGFYEIGLFFLLLGSVSLGVVFVVYLIRQPHELSVKFMVVGSLCQMIGHFMLISKQFYPMAFPWWMGFLLFVIVGERIELSKFLPVTKRDKNILILLLSIFLFGLVLPFHGVGKYLSGICLVLIALWLLRHDVISIGLKKDGLFRFSAIALFAGCIMLMLTGIFILALPDLPFAYDAIVHTFFIGFTFSMIFAHGPIIIPGVLGIKVKPYHPFLYVPVCLSLLSLLVRLMADIQFLPYVFRSWSGWISTFSILLYFTTLWRITILGLNHDKAT